jgi:hypothetical protein
MLSGASAVLQAKLQLSPGTNRLRAEANNKRNRVKQFCLITFS